MATPLNRALLLRRRPARTTAARDTIPRRPPGAAPVSFGQEQIWLHSQLAPETPLYTESLTVHRAGPLDCEAFVASVREVVRRHEIWRTTFAWSDGQLVQRIQPDPDPQIRDTDLRHLSEPEREPAALRLAREDLLRPFDLSSEPGLRARLVTLSDGDHRLFLSLHHIVFDGISIYRVLLSELTALYGARVRGDPCPLEALPLQYADFASWERHRLDEAAMDAHARYWRTQLAGAPPMIDLPADRPRPARQSFQAGLVRFEIPADLMAVVRHTALHAHCTLFMVLLASFSVTLHGWSGQTDMVIGSVSGGREHRDLDRLIGYFLRMLVLRVDLRGNPTVRALLGRVRDTLLDALEHDALPFQRLIRAVAHQRDLESSPLFQVTLSIEPPKPDPPWDVSEMDAGAVASKFDLSVELEDRGDTVRGRAIYSVDLFDAATIADLMDDWIRLLSEMVADPERRLAALPQERRP